VRPKKRIPTPVENTLTANPRVLLGFSSMSDHEVEETAGAVLAGLYANATIYPTPPVTQAVLQGKLTAFTDAMAA
jgi:hypothetical protein